MREHPIAGRRRFIARRQVSAEDKWNHFFSPDRDGRSLVTPYLDRRCLNRLRKNGKPEIPRASLRAQGPQKLRAGKDCCLPRPNSWNITAELRCSTSQLFTCRQCVVVVRV